MIGVKITDNRSGKQWVEARSMKRAIRRAAQKAYGPMSGRQWKKARRSLIRAVPQNA